MEPGDNGRLASGPVNVRLRPAFFSASDKLAAVVQLLLIEAEVQSVAGFSFYMTEQTSDKSRH